MNENEKYFKISKSGHVHTLSDRIPFKWKELIVWTSTSFLVLIYFLGLGVGIYVAILTLIGYVFYRFAAWMFYSELKIDEKSGKIIRLKKLLDRVQKEELITERFDSSRFAFRELVRSGKAKYLMIYRTHKDIELLVLKNQKDKVIFERYIVEKIQWEVPNEEN